MSQTSPSCLVVCALLFTSCQPEPSVIGKNEAQSGVAVTLEDPAAEASAAVPSTPDNPTPPTTDQADSVTRTQEDPLPSVVAWESLPLEPETNTVLVIDSGFDVHHPIFKGKIKRSYTLACFPNPNAIAVDFTDFDTLKTTSLQALNVPNQVCELQDGVLLPKSTVFDEIAQHKEEWNSTITQKVSPAANFDPTTLNKISNAVDGRNAAGQFQYLYHGTATAGAISYRNPSVRFVFLQMSLGAPGSGNNANNCPTQADVDAIQNLKLLSADEDYKNAYLQAPTDPTTGLLEKLIAKHNVQYVNFSAGAAPYSIMLQSFANAQCDMALYQPFVEGLRDYRIALHELEKQRAAEKVTPTPYDSIVFVQSAGNNGVVINSAADAVDCQKDANTVLVGSFNHQRELSSFSQSGNCVDSYSFGENVILPAPDGFYTVQSGTSFSGPLVTRLLSLENNPADTVPNKIAKLISLQNPVNKYVIPEKVPEELMFEKKDITTFQAGENSSGLLFNTLLGSHPFKKSWSLEQSLSQQVTTPR